MSWEAGAEPRRVTLGLVWSDAFAVLRRDGLVLGLIAVLLGGVPALLIGLISVAAQANPDYGAALGIVGLVDLPLIFILQGALVHGASQALAGSTPAFGASLGAGSRAWLALLGQGLLIYGAVIGIPLVCGLLFTGLYAGLHRSPWVAVVGAAVVLGALAPAFMLLARWSVSVPALLSERLGVRAAMGRSARLTKGDRWTIFLIFLALWGVVSALNLQPGKDFSNIMAASPFRRLVITPLLQVIAPLLSYTLTSSLFHRLRLAREGGGAESLAKLFD